MTIELHLTKGAMSPKRSLQADAFALAQSSLSIFPRHADSLDLLDQLKEAASKS